MARKKNIHRTKRLEVRPPPGVLEYLEDVVRLQTMGKTAQDVVERFVGERIEQLIKDGTLKRRSWKDDAATHGTR